MPIADSIIYGKKSLKWFLKQPGFARLLSFVRYYPSWLAHLQPGRNPVGDQTPWMNFAAIDFLRKIVHKEMRVFEFGSGGSTMFWQSRVQEVISVEHDLSWYNNMKKILDQGLTKNVRYILAEPEVDPLFDQKDFRNPADFISNDREYQGKTFEKYAKAIDAYPETYFDVVIVDGRARPSCIQQGMSRLKKNGWLVVDNSERKYYTQPFIFDSNSWDIRKFAGPVPYMRDFSETSFFKKLI